MSRRTKKIFVANNQAGINRAIDTPTEVFKMRRWSIAVGILLFTLRGSASFTHGQDWWLSSGTVPTSYFGLHVQSYNYNFPPTEAWPTTKGFPLTIVRNFVWTPGDNTCCATGPQWQFINTSNGVYDWSGMDVWVAVNQSKNVDMIFCMGYLPSWTGDGGKNPTPTQVTNFYSALATRYAGKIKYYEGLNEFPSFYSGTIAQLVAIQQAMYQAVKAADPNAIILSPAVAGMATSGAAAYSSFLAAGGKQWMDVAAFHGYVDHHGETLVTAVSNLRTVLNANGLSNIPIFDTEGAWNDTPGQIVSDTLQVAFTIKAYVLEYWLGVSRKIWYAYDSSDVGTFYLENTGNLTNAGTAYTQVAIWLTGASLNGKFQLTNGSIWYGDLTRSGNYQARIIWTPADRATAYSVPAQFTQYRNYKSIKHSIVGGNVTLGIIPILLESGDPP